MSVHYNITANNEDFKRKFAEVRNEIKSSETTAQRASNNIQTSLKRMAAGMGGLFAVNMFKNMVKDIERVRGEFQQLEIAFTTMLGSKQLADQLMRQAVETAAKTPFDLMQVASGYKQLMAYGMEFEKLNDTLIMLGDVASGVGAPLNDIVYLYGTLKASGRVVTMDIRQFAGRGIPIYEELAKVLGVATNQINELVSAGKVGFEDIEQAFKNMTSEGGRFNHLMEKQSASIVGLKANLGDAIDTARNDIGKKLQPVFEGLLKTQLNIVENYEEIGKTILGLAAAFGSYKAVLIAVSAVERLNIRLLRQAVLERKLAAMSMQVISKEQAIYIARTKMLTIAKQGLGRSLKSLLTVLTPNPYVLLATAVAGLTFSVYKLITAENAAEIAAKSLTEAQEKRTQAIGDERKKTEELINKLKDETLTRRERQSSLETLQKKYPAIFKNLDIETAKYLNLSDVLKQVNEQLELKTRAQIRYEIATAQELLNRLQSGKIMSFSERGELNRILGLKWSESIFISANEMIGALEKHISGLKDQENAMLLSSYNAVSNEVKRARLIEQRNELQEKYNELASQEQSIWAGNEFARTAQLELYEKQILHLNKQIEEYGTTIGTTVEKNKAYWEEEKKNAEEALGLLTEKNTAKEWEEARQRIIRAEKELDRYRVSIKEEETPDYYIFPRITRENTERIIEEVREFNKKMLSENEKAVKEQFKAEEEARIEYLIRWGNFEEKKNALIDKFNKEAKEARTKAEEDNLFRVLLEDLDRLAVEEFRGKIDFAEIFSNIDEKSVGAIKILRDKLAKYIELAANSMSPEQLKPLTDALLEMDVILRERKPGLALAESLEKAISAYKDLKEAEESGLSEDRINEYRINFQNAMAELAVSIQNVINQFEELGNIAISFIGIFNDEAAEAANNILDIASGAAEAGAGVSRIFSGDIIGGTKNLARGITSVTDSIVGMFDSSKEKRIKRLQEQIDQLTVSYNNLGKEIERAYSADASRLIEQQNKLLQQRQIALRRQIAEEKAKKKTNKKRIAEWEKELEEIDRLIAENKEKAIDAIFGEDVQSAIENFASAYASMFDAGKDSAKTAKDFVTDMIKKMVMEAIKGSIETSKFMENFRNQMMEFMKSGGMIDAYEQAILEEMAEKELARLEREFGWAGKYFKGAGETQGAATYGAYEKITQEQASSIDGKLNGIQMSAITISDTSKSIKSVADETYKLIFLQVSHLESIKKNTALLVETNERLDKIVKNTSNL